SQGTTQFQQINEYDNVTNKNKLVCEGWSASSRVEIKLADMTKWPQLQEKLSELIDSASASAKTAGSKTVAQINTVAPRLYPETQQKIADDAMVESLNDAARKAEIAMATYKLCFVAMKSITPSSGREVPYSQ